jgi:D-lactate dehydrogenase (cytochrome)
LLHIRNPGQFKSGLHSNSGGLAQGPTKTAQRRLLLDVSLGLIGSALLGYSFAKWSTKRPSSAHESSLANHKPQYGSPEDFQKAIVELKTAFTPDSVSTNADVLYAHGFSMNDYHPGIFLKS